MTAQKRLQLLVSRFGEEQAERALDCPGRPPWRPPQIRLTRGLEKRGINFPFDDGR
jgi:hypothetical protein